MDCDRSQSAAPCPPSLRDHTGGVRAGVVVVVVVVRENRGSVFAARTSVGEDVSLTEVRRLFVGWGVVVFRSGKTARTRLTL